MRKNWTVLLTVLLATALPVIAYLLPRNVDEDSLGLVLRVTGRIALLIYLLIFVARPLRQLVVSPASAWLLKNRRYLGISFATVMSVHLVLLIMLNGIPLAIPGIAAYALMYLMLITSFDGPAAALGPRRWRLLHKTGLYVIGAILVVVTAGDLIATPGDPLRIAIALLLLAAIVVRVAAYLKRRAAKPA